MSATRPARRARMGAQVAPLRTRAARRCPRRLSSVRRVTADRAGPSRAYPPDPNRSTLSTAISVAGWGRGWGQRVKSPKMQMISMMIGGDGGIRTLDRALQPYNGLANRRLQPLGHISAARRDSRPPDMPDARAHCKTRAQTARSFAATAPLGRTEFCAPLRPGRGRPSRRHGTSMTRALRAVGPTDARLVARQTLVHDAEQAIDLDRIAIDRVGDLLARVEAKMMGLPRQRPESAHLPEQPFGDGDLLARPIPAETAALAREIAGSLRTQKTEIGASSGLSGSMIAGLQLLGEIARKLGSNCSPRPMSTVRRSYRKPHSSSTIEILPPFGVGQ